MNKEAEVTLVDCTLRDGGYYNAWDFSNDLIEEYLAAMASAKVDCVEIGFRSTERGTYKGACAYSTDRYLDSLSIPEALTIGIMINASEYINRYGVREETLRKTFIDSKSSRVDLVRIATHFGDFETTLNMPNGS